MGDEQLEAGILKAVWEALNEVARTGKLVRLGLEFRAAVDGGEPIEIRMYAVPKGERLPVEAIPVLGQIRVAVDEAGLNGLQTQFELDGPEPGKEVVVMIGPKSILTKAQTEPMHVPDDCRGRG